MENLQLFMVKKLGKCPVCKGQLIREIDSESRSWARCLDCSIRIPLEEAKMTKPGEMEIDRWDVEAWAARSRKGEVCGIFGCPNKPTTKCKHCFNMYCDEHKEVIELPGHKRAMS